MADFESEIKYMAAPVERVYAKLSDLNNLRTIQEGLNNPMVQQAIRQQAGDQMDEQKMQQLVKAANELRFDADSVTLDAGIAGTITLRVVSREPDRTVKFAVDGAPMAANFWIQLLPVSSGGSKMKLTLRAELNFLMKQMLKGKLAEGIDKVASVLAALPY